MSMSSSEVTDHLKRSMTTTAKIAEGAIEFHKAKIRELEAVVRAAQRVVADAVIPTSMVEVNQHATLREIPRVLGNGQSHAALDSVQTTLKQLEAEADQADQAAG